MSPSAEIAFFLVLCALTLVECKTCMEHQDTNVFLRRISEQYDAGAPDGGKERR